MSPALIAILSLIGFALVTGILARFVKKRRLAKQAASGRDTQLPGISTASTNMQAPIV